MSHTTIYFLTEAAGFEKAEKRLRHIWKPKTFSTIPKRFLTYPARSKQNEMTLRLF
jgi:hypothetical protein